MMSIFKLFVVCLFFVTETSVLVSRVTDSLAQSEEGSGGFTRQSISSSPTLELWVMMRLPWEMWMWHCTSGSDDVTASGGDTNNSRLKGLFDGSQKTMVIAFARFLNRSFYDLKRV